MREPRWSSEESDKGGVGLIQGKFEKSCGGVDDSALTHREREREREREKPRAGPSSVNRSQGLRGSFSGLLLFPVHPGFSVPAEVGDFHGEVPELMMRKQCAWSDISRSAIFFYEVILFYIPLIEFM